MSNSIIVDINNNVQTITLNRPEKKNAFNTEMITAWAEALQLAQHNDDVHVVIVTGSGSAFCAGGDIGNIKAGKPSRLEAKNMLWEDIHRIAFQMNKMDKPVIAAINGPAVGAGLDMALMADIRTMANETKVSEGYIKVGLIPGDGGAYYLPRIVGQSKALELLWTGKPVEAEEAKEIGLVDHIYPSEQLLTETTALAESIAAGPQVAIRMIKRSVRQSANLDLETSLDLISSHMAIITDTDDHKEAIDAFIEKRQPKFTGK